MKKFNLFIYLLFFICIFNYLIKKQLHCLLTLFSISLIFYLIIGKNGLELSMLFGILFSLVFFSCKINNLIEGKTTAQMKAERAQKKAERLKKRKEKSSRKGRGKAGVVSAEEIKERELQKKKDSLSEDKKGAKKRGSAMFKLKHGLR